MEAISLPKAAADWMVVGDLCIVVTGKGRDAGKHWRHLISAIRFRWQSCNGVTGKGVGVAALGGH